MRVNDSERTTMMYRKINRILNIFLALIGCALTGVAFFPGIGTWMFSCLGPDAYCVFPALCLIFAIVSFVKFHLVYDRMKKEK